MSMASISVPFGGSRLSAGTKPFHPQGPSVRAHEEDVTAVCICYTSKMWVLTHESPLGNEFCFNIWHKSNDNCRSSLTNWSVFYLDNHWQVFWLGSSCELVSHFLLLIRSHFKKWENFKRFFHFLVREENKSNQIWSYGHGCSLPVIVEMHLRNSRRAVLMQDKLVQNKALFCILVCNIFSMLKHQPCGLIK